MIELKDLLGKFIVNCSHPLTSLASFLHYARDRLLPRICLLCGASSQRFSQICEKCLSELPILPDQCLQCGQFITLSGAICGNCLITAKPFDHTFTLFPYEAPIIQFIIQLKFQHKLYYAEALGELIAHAIQTSWYQERKLPDLIIPVPLHPKRLRERGFNQSLEIARPISHTLSIPIDKYGLKRIKATHPQSSLLAKQRKQNVAHAFTATKRYTGLTLALIDDVITTGHTVTECARILKRAGARSIDVWCCARRG